MKNKSRHLTLQIKSLDPADGSFVGYGSVFGVKDSYGDVVVKGAFQHSLTHKMPKLLWQHRSDAPIGVFTAAREDEHGLRLEGQLAIETTQGKDAYALMKMGAVDALSIGYYLQKFDVDKEQKTLFIKEVDLLEVSLVTFPANQEAQIQSVKSDWQDSQLNKEFGDLLRRVKELESKITEGSVAEVEIEEEAEAETHESGEDDGAETRAIEVALNNLLTAMK